MKPSDSLKHEQIELGDSDLANRLELVVNTATANAIPVWLRSVLVVVVILQIVGIPTIIGTILLGQFGGRNCPQPYYEQPINGES